METKFNEIQCKYFLCFILGFFMYVNRIYADFNGSLAFLESPLLKNKHQCFTFYFMMPVRKLYL